ncbi:RDD family protein [Nocardia sp. 348MFTsu5.1]|uniref:RDD family protein n=1 Tax=Nocardia sp. 348MFTsu5.1 TaxID=1172185 RepID=UPI0003611BB4|nr:RDD family protein [Nocardia sp. 348MFTsu5.1]
MSGPQYSGSEPYPGPGPGANLPPQPKPGAYPPPPGGGSPYGQPAAPYAQPAPQFGPPGPQSGAGAPADVGIRLGARIIDWLIVAIPMNIIYTVLFLAAPWFIALVLGFVLSFAAFAYFVYFETQQDGATIAKKLLKLRVIGAAGGTPTIDESAKRNLWMLVGVLAWLPIFFLPLFLGLAWLGLAISIAVTINSDPRKQGWHDKFAGGTSVVKTA